MVEPPKVRGLHRDAGQSGAGSAGRHDDRLPIRIANTVPRNLTDANVTVLFANGLSISSFDIRFQNLTTWGQAGPQWVGLGDLMFCTL